MATKKTSNSAKRPPRKKISPHKWSQKVNESSNAMDLETGVFKLKDPKKIALSVKRSAERSKRRKAGPFHSAMSMLSFYQNRAGKNLNATEKSRLQRAKEALRELFGKKAK